MGNAGWVRGRGTRSFRVLCAGLGGLWLLGCDVGAIKACHEDMGTSQKAMLDMDSSELEQVESTLAAVQKTLAVCNKAGRADEVAKIADAERKLLAQVNALKERAGRKARPKLTDAELAELEKKGDPTCPKGQQYEHHQNKKLINCTGPQLVEMNWESATEYFERRGFTQIGEGTTLSFEKGVERYDFEFASQNSQTAAQCLSVTSLPGVPWEETVTRLTSVHPRKLSLEKPVLTKSGPLALLVEGTATHFTVKLGKCALTPGQSPYKAPEKPAL